MQLKIAITKDKCHLKSKQHKSHSEKLEVIPSWGGGGGGGLIALSCFYHSENMYWVTLNAKIYLNEFFTPHNPPCSQYIPLEVRTCIWFCRELMKQMMACVETRSIGRKCLGRVDYFESADLPHGV